MLRYKVAYSFFLIHICVFAEFIPFLEGFREKITRDSTLYQHVQYFEDAYNLNHYAKVEPSKEPRIPKSIHMIWLGSPLPKRFVVFVNSWKQHHPDWEFRLWTDEDIDAFPFVTGDAIHRVQNYGQKSDIFRYEILNRFGGLYVDTDFFCVRPHDILHYTCDFYTGMGSKVVYNGNIGAAPGHPIIQNCLNMIKRNKSFKNSYFSIVNKTGPHLFRRAILSHIKDHPEGCIVYPTVFFYNFPVQLKRLYWRRRNPNILRRYAKKAFAVHAWALSWTKHPSS